MYLLRRFASSSSFECQFRLWGLHLMDFTKSSSGDRSDMLDPGLCTRDPWEAAPFSLPRIRVARSSCLRGWHRATWSALFVTAFGISLSYPFLSVLDGCSLFAVSGRWEEITLTHPWCLRVQRGIIRCVRADNEKTLLVGL